MHIFTALFQRLFNLALTLAVAYLSRVNFGGEIIGANHTYVTDFFLKVIT
jgi:hypothetical protein